ncbi:MAG: TatD family hydrolase [Phycisphaerales bacterium]|nr:TatD family hydrolase [Phycisphaerales bacterium]MCB9854056.1 TatD family hydrolase [Phycisphaerales bacterium]MCB9864366.1 TatD family hydrolase [Phycisphaerales bacterium]
MTWIDSHCHLTYDGLAERLDEVLDRAAAVGVTDCVCIGTDLKNAVRVLELSDQYSNIHAVAGVHPHEAGKVEKGWVEALTGIVSRGDVYAVGEMGLDYHYDFADRDAQKRVFEAQLAIAADVAKPIVIHCREAHVDTLEILEAAAPTSPVVFHCFTGTLNEALEIIDAGYWISLTGVVTFKKSDELREVARRIPGDRLMVETDSPYLAPEPVRSKRPNEPAYVVHTGRCIAEVRGEDIEAFATRVRANTIRFYGLPTHAAAAPGK